LQLDPDEKITAIFPASSYEEGYLIFVTKRGFIKKTGMGSYAHIRQNGLQAVGLRDDDELICVFKGVDNDTVIVGTKNGMSVRFQLSDVREMGRLAMGVIAVNLKSADDIVVDAAIVYPDNDILVITENGYGKRTPESEYKIQRRSGSGIKTLQITQKTGNLVALKVVSGTEDLMIVNDAGVIIRVNISEISTFGRSTQGVRLMRLTEDLSVVSVAVMPESEDEDEEEVLEVGETTEQN
jgi:DNA gyrase subunit A